MPESPLYHLLTQLIKLLDFDWRQVSGACAQMTKNYGGLQWVREREILREEENMESCNKQSHCTCSRICLRRYCLRISTSTTTTTTTMTYFFFREYVFKINRRTARNSNLKIASCCREVEGKIRRIRGGGMHGHL